MADTTLTHIPWEHHPLDGTVPTYPPGQHPLNQKLTRQQIKDVLNVRTPQAPAIPDDLVNAPVFDRCRDLQHEIRARRDDAMMTIRYSHSTDEGMYLFELTYLAAAQHVRSLAGALADWLAELPGHGALVPDQVIEIDPTKGEYFDPVAWTFDEVAAQVNVDTIMGSRAVQNWVLTTAANGVTLERGG